MDSDDDGFPSMPSRSPSANTLSHTLEASASTVWSLLFIAYSSSTFVSEFSTGWAGIWTLLLVCLPLLLTGIPNIMDKRPHAVPVLLSYVAYVVIPSLLQLCKPSRSSTGLQQYSSTGDMMIDVLTVAVIWLPLHLRLLSRSLSVTQKVAWPMLIAALNIVNMMTVLTPFPSSHPLGYTYKLGPFDLATALTFAIPAVVAVVAVVVISRFAKLRRFTNNNNMFAMSSGGGAAKNKNTARLIATFFGLFMNALAEELLFRGLIFNVIALHLTNNSSGTPHQYETWVPVVPTLISSTLFAVGHLSKSKLGFDAPNFRFAACAFVASVFYCMVWFLTSKVSAVAITHAIVDFTVYHILVTPNIQS